MKLEAGFSVQEITPELGGELSGYGYYLNRISEAVQDPLFARALVFRIREELFVLLDLDLLGITEKIAGEVHRILFSRYAIPSDHVMILSIHTHTGPAVGSLVGCGEIDEKTVERLPHQIVSAVERAVTDLSEVTSLQTSESPVREPIGYNRTGAEPMDPSIRRIVILRKDRRPICVVSYACHPVVYGRSARISADYPGAVVRELDRRGFDGLFLNGACGDIDPIINRTAWGTGTPETMKAYALQLLDGLGQKTDSEKIPDSIRVLSVGIDMPLYCLAEEEIEAMKVASGKPSGDVQRQEVAFRIWIEKVRENQQAGYGGSESIYVQLMRLGRILFVGVPYETFTSIADRIRSSFPGYLVFVLGNANVTTGYLPDREALQMGASYGTLGSCVAYGRLPFTVEAPDLLIHRTVEGLYRLLQD